MLLFCSVATIGFTAVEVSEAEDSGSIEFTFGVLSGELGYSQNITFFTSDGTATSGMPNIKLVVESLYIKKTSRS